MYQTKLIPYTKDRQEAESNIQALQSERIVEDGRIRLMCEALQFYADGHTDAGERAKRALATSGVSFSEWQRYAISEAVSRTLPNHDGSARQ